MNVSEPFIRRPIATSLLGLATLLAGLMGYFALPVSSLPQVDFPTVQVTTQLPGASPDTITKLVTAPLERQLGQIAALERMTSSSSFGISQITLQFALERDIDDAAQDVQAAINAAGSSLPRTLPYPPTYAKVNPADAPIVTLALTSDTVSLRELSDIADTLLTQRLSAVTGVGHVSIQGGIKPAVRIQVDLPRLASYGLSMSDLRSAIAGANVAGPKGSLDGAHQAYTIAANDQLATAEAYRNLVIAYRNGAPVQLNDIAHIVDGLENDKVGAWYTGKPALSPREAGSSRNRPPAPGGDSGGPSAAQSTDAPDAAATASPSGGKVEAGPSAPAIVIDVQRQPGANVIETVERVRAELPRLQKAMPSGVRLTLVHDRTGTIRASIRDVQFTLVLSVALVVLVVLVFLRTIRATAIAAVALPVSLVATFGVMWLAGFSLDNLSLMALTIGTGFVVDDAIVMIENIVRHMENGESRMQAALAGAKEIGFTVISLTMSLIAVFIPLLFMTGLVGRMFREFALTLTIAVVVSAVVSLTLTPMMCARLLRQGGEAGPDAEAGTAAARRPGFLSRVANGALSGTLRGYHASLEWVLRHQLATLIATAGTLAVTVWLYAVAPKGFLPAQDTGLVMAMLEAAPEVSFAEMQRLQGAVTEAVRRDGDVTNVVAVAGVGRQNATPNVARLAITLKSRDERSTFVTGIVDRLQRAVADVPGAQVYFQPVQDIQISTRTSRAQYQYTLAGTDPNAVKEWSAKVLEQLATAPQLQNAASEGQDGGLRVAVKVDRDMASRLGVSMQAVNDTLNDAFGQRQVSTIYAQSNQYRVILEAKPELRNDLTALGRLHVPASGGRQIPLEQIARIEPGTTPLSIQRQDQLPSATLSFNLAPGAALSDAVAAIRTIERDIGMPTSVTSSYAGDAAEFARALAGQPWLILAAVVTIYIVLGVLYESFIHPFTILTTLPSAGIGAVLALTLTGLDLSLVALIGIVLLMGIVKKNAILMIDFALDAERQRGFSPREAIVEACLKRFRPIMMTTLAALLGALPLALETGTGSELRYPLGVTIIGGLLLSQLLTLYTTPVIYLAMERLRVRLGGAATDSARRIDTQISAQFSPEPASEQTGPRPGTAEAPVRRAAE